MAGALVVEGDIDEVPEIAAAQERIFIFQQIPYNKQKGGTVEFDDVLAPFSTPQNPRFTTINGQLKPIINMQPGEVQRWRFIHAGIKEKLTIALDQHQLSVIAHDGITTGRRDDKLVVELFPGYRADVLVKADKRPGTYKLHDSADVNGLFDAETEQELADVVVAGEVKDMRLPEPSQLKPLAPLEDLRGVPLTRDPIRIKFKNAAGQFTVCGKLFKPDDPPIEMKLNSVDEWILTTEAIGTRPRQHPFHIHVNPFQIMSIGGVNQEYLWRDTVIVKENEPVVMRTRYRNFPGQSVLHCHILDHEDRGMMLKINIVEGEPTPFPCP
jgi:FtsP/CotA-like multicopper oxidase with cupredoxin domain